MNEVMFREATVMNQTKQLCYQTSGINKQNPTVCPWNVFIGRSIPSLHTWMHWSVEHDANVALLCQSTSSAGAVDDKHNNDMLTFFFTS